MRVGRKNWNSQFWNSPQSLSPLRLRRPGFCKEHIVLMFSPFPQLVRRLSGGISRFAPLRSSSRWDNIQKIVPALRGKGKDKFKWMEVSVFSCW